SACKMLLCVNIGYIPRFINGPALDGVEVIDRSERTVRSSNGDQLLQGWLHVTGFIGATALQDRRLAVPDPRKAETNRANRRRKRIKLRRIPGLAAIDRDIDRLHAPAAAPSQAGDVVEAGARQLHIAGGKRNN